MRSPYAGTRRPSGIFIVRLCPAPGMKVGMRGVGKSGSSGITTPDVRSVRLSLVISDTYRYGGERLPSSASFCKCLAINECGKSACSASPG